MLQKLTIFWWTKSFSISKKWTIDKWKKSQFLEYHKISKEYEGWHHEAPEKCTVGYLEDKFRRLFTFCTFLSLAPILSPMNWIIQKFFSWNCISGSFELFTSLKIDFWPFSKLQKMEYYQKFFSWNWFIWLHKFFWPGFF